MAQPGTRNPRGSSLPFWRYEIARQQIQVHAEALRFQLLRVRAEMGKRAVTPVDEELVRQLEIQLSANAEAQSELEARPHRRKRFRDRIRLRLWRWATRGRFERWVPASETIPQ